MDLQGASEPQLRTALKVCVSLTGLWAPPSTLPCLSAWDFYHKHMVSCVGLTSCLLATTPG